MHEVTRKQLTDKLVESVDSWDLDMLINYAKTKTFQYCEELTDNELQEEYDFIFPKEVE